MKKSKIQFLNDCRGQGLLELIIAIGVITVGLFGVWTLFLSNFSGEREAGTRLVASNLAREGVELVKNIRDTNWLRAEVNDTSCVLDLDNEEVCKWDDGLSDGDYVPDNIFTGAEEYLKLTSVSNGIDDLSAKLNVNENGFYINGDGVPTPYRRLITISSICCADTNADLKCDDSNFDDCDSGNLKIGINVQSHVRWEVNNQPRNIVLVDQIYNWK